MSCELINKIGTGDCEHDTNYKGEQTFATIIASELVSEILEDALDIVEDIEEKASIKAVENILDNLSNKFQSENPTMSEKIESSCASPLKGLGDQLEPDEGIEEDTPVKHPPVEKKSRLTDLVKNSKQMLAKLILSESGKVTGKEKVLRVVDLDSGDQPYKIQKKIAPEEVPLPRNDSKEILSSNKEDTNMVMDDIRLCYSQDKGTQKGEAIDSLKTKKTMTFPMASGSGKHLSLAARYRSLKFSPELKTKKWNIGSKIVNYIRKHKKDGKDKEKQTSDGVEFKPRDDDNN